jgi:hypothetical protein
VKTSFVLSYLACYAIEFVFSIHVLMAECVLTIKGRKKKKSRADFVYFTENQGKKLDHIQIWLISCGEI